MNKALFLAPLITLVLAFAALTKVMAVSYDISGNGAGSTNNVTVNQQNNSTVNQSNTSNVSNNVNSNCNTGGNSTSGNTGANGSTSTGDCSTNVNIQNNLNSNSAKISCPTCPKSSSTPQPGSNPPGVGGPGGGSSSSGSGGSGGTSGGGQVLGETGVAENTAIMLGGMAFIFAGLWKTRKILA